MQFIVGEDGRVLGYRNTLTKEDVPMIHVEMKNGKPVVFSAGVPIGELVPLS